MTMNPAGDNRRVVLIKSLATNNRFYAIVNSDSEIRNADMIESIPNDLLLGVAYPCLEDGLNDFAVIRTTFETLDLFPDDDPIREEMMEIINDARSNLLRRLFELRDKIRDNKAHFLGTDYNEFKTYTLDIVRRGYPRRNLDSMMKLNVFGSVAEAEGHSDSNDLLYFYEFGLTVNMGQLEMMPPREFIVTLFEDVLISVQDDSYYKNKYQFDRNVFQKFIAVMFVNYATTDPMFYGINKRDYGVSGDKDMDGTPLYIAIRRELTEIEERFALNGSAPATIPPITPVSSKPAPALSETILTSEDSIPSFLIPANNETLDHAGRISYDEASNLLPGELVNEDVLMGPITSLCSAASLLIRKSDPETERFARVILADASRLVAELKRLGILSPVANDPGSLG